jgi:hypothetical protein
VLCARAGVGGAFAAIFAVTDAHLLLKHRRLLPLIATHACSGLVSSPLSISVLPVLALNLCMLAAAGLGAPRTSSGATGELTPSRARAA